jgi:hypothetical protein
MAKFQKGTSGNPSGRPKSDTANLKLLLAKHGQDVLQVVIDAAMDGDLAACKLVLDRLYPAIKPQSLPINIEVSGTLTEQGEAIIVKTLEGGIAPDVGSGLITMLSNQGKLVELDTLVQRLEDIENTLITIAQAKQ